MLRPDGAWSAPPPTYQCIIAPATGHTNTLPRHRDMARDLYRGGPPVPASEARPDADEDACPATAAARQQAQHAAQGEDTDREAGAGLGRDHHTAQSASNDRRSVPAIAHLASLHTSAFGQVFNESDMLQAFGVTCEEVLSAAYAHLPEPA
jgi:hypothetical protein